MRRIAAVLALLVALPASAQGWGKVASGWTKINNSGYAAMPAPSGCAATYVPFFGSTVTLGCDTGLAYNATTDTLTTGTVAAGNVTATALASPGSITVANVLSRVASITTVAGSALVDGDYFTVKYDTGLTIPVEFDLSPGDGTTGGRVPLLFTAGDSADTIRDNIILLLNAAAPTKITASSGGAATVSIVLDTPGAAGDTNTENVTNAGFAISGFVDPTHATTQTYKLVARLPDGTTTAAGAASTTSTGTATLSTANFNRLTWSAVAGASGYDVYRTVGGATQGKIVSATTALTVDDTGLAGGGETAPTVNGTGMVTGREAVMRGAGTAALAATLVTGGSFPDLSAWTIGGAGTGWTSSTGALHTAGNTDPLSQSLTLAASSLYYVTVTASGATAGTLTMTLGALTGSYAIANGANYYSFESSGSGATALTFTPTALYDGKLTSVSVQRVTAASVTPMLTGTDGSGNWGFSARALVLPTGVANSGWVNGNTLYYDHTDSWGAQSVAIGYLALSSNVTGYQNTAVGAQSMQKNVTGFWNTAYGQGALFANLTGYRNTALGYASTQYNVSGKDNVGVGFYSLYTNSTGDSNTAVGAYALQSATTASGNTAVGYTSQYSGTTAIQNTSVGYRSLRNTTGSANTAVGYDVLFTNAAGQNNTGLGYNALYANTSGASNTAIGANALQSNTTTGSSTAVGYYALAGSTVAGNTAIGTQAGQSVSTGSENTLLGYLAGRPSAGNATTTGANNTFVGARTGQASSTQRSNATAIGANATVDASNVVVLGDTAVTDVLAGSAAGATVNAGKFKLSALNTAPASASATGTAGEIRVTATAIYVCTATDTWVKANLATW